MPPKRRHSLCGRCGAGCLALLLLGLATDPRGSGHAFVPQPSRPLQVWLSGTAALLAPLGPLGGSTALATDSATWRSVVNQKAAGGLGDAGTGNISLLIGCLVALVVCFVAVSSLFKSYEDKPLP
uniref:Uncharacterized protein n=1 Tax=Pyrodinium bahamense TaxID=73915 RepID=A0A7S0AVZ8_9DINO|mmetsp:Transcript_43363/g.120567  ORF Transcript_43363/g.120567 Transcript_43363/m.120567 type:complete len:125 (+) Transcript_43363:87-461(+)